MAANSPVAGLPYSTQTDPANFNQVTFGLASAVDHMCIPNYTSLAARDIANPTPQAGDVCFIFTNSADTQGFYFYGSRWVGPYAFDRGFNSYTPTWGITAGTAPSIGNGTQRWAYRREGFMLRIQFLMIFGSTTNFGTTSTTDNWTWSLPESDWKMDLSSGYPYAPFISGFASIDGSGAAWTYFQMVPLDDSHLVMQTVEPFCNGTGLTNAGYVDAFSPLTWLPGGFLQGTGYVLLTKSETA